MPTPLSRPLHYAPKGWHRFETFVGLWVVEVVTPFLLLLPGGFGAPGALGLSAALRTAAAAMQLLFQAVLIQQTKSSDAKRSKMLAKIPLLAPLSPAQQQMRI